MKVGQLTLLIVLIPFALSNCLFQDKPEPVEVLPPKTSEGLNTFGCKIDGEVWAARWDQPFISLTSVDTIQLSYSGGTSIADSEVTIHLNRDVNSEPKSYMEVRLESLFLTDSIPLKTMISGREMTNGVRYYKSDSTTDNKEFFTMNSTSNYLKITTLDTMNNVFSGTFQFDLVSVNDTSKILEVRDGRFDISIP